MEKILRFTASWCSPCKALAKNLEYAKLDIPVEVVDIDVNSELTQEYGIRGVPTMVHLPSKKSLVGVKMADEIERWLELCRA